MTPAVYYGLVILTTLCSDPLKPTDKCIDYHSTFVQEEPFFTNDDDKNKKWCTDSKVFVEDEMEDLFSDYTIMSMECSFKVIPYLSKEILKKQEGFE